MSRCCLGRCQVSVREIKAVRHRAALGYDENCWRRYLW
ncbi:Protein of unknown function [Pyronema omphalodes CBS 100304]|uniref:Uncharacterized protein n=1 Tax=Pyronema omphalodes (strain CBS 100304) TaxID=1076935 RepID=U4L1S2_PYROM|nr:Protein of unknown function [Pyronema omphalodes CBS 100304]